MKETLGAPFRSPRVKAALSYPFRLGSPDTKWTSTPFSGLAIVNALSGAGDAMVTVALAGSVFVSVSLHAARGRTALGLLCTVLPFAVVGPFVGPVIDRFKGGRKVIVFLAAIGRMAACLMMAAWIHSLLLFPAAFLSLVCSKTHAVAKASLVPGVVEDTEDLVRANSKLAIGSSVATSAAAALGALIYRLLGSHVLLDTDVLVFAAMAGLSLYLLSGAREPHRDEAPAPAPVPADTTERIAVTNVRTRRPRPQISMELALAQIAMAGMRAAAGFLTALVVFAFRRQGAPVIWYGLVAVASVGGNFGGAVLAPALRARFSERLLVGGAAVGIGVTAVAAINMATDHRRPAALLLAVVIGLGASVAKAAFDAIVQSDTLDTDRSRLFARFESLFQLVWVLGALVPTLIAVSLFAGFILVAVLVVVTSTVFVAGLAQRRDAGSADWQRSEPPPAPAPAPGWGPPPPPQLES